MFSEVVTNGFAAVGHVFHKAFFEDHVVRPVGTDGDAGFMEGVDLSFAYLTVGTADGDVFSANRRSRPWHGL